MMLGSASTLPSRFLLSRNISSLRSHRSVRRLQPNIPYNATTNSKAIYSPKPSRNATPTNAGRNSLLAPVHTPEDPDSVLRSGHPASRILENSALVVQRQLELGNLLLGFEQANKYVIMDPNGSHVGFMAEEESGIVKIVARQWFHTHRAFTTYVFDKHENEVLRFHRPFSWINSAIRVFDPIGLHSSMTRLSMGLPSSSLASGNYSIIGEAQQQWHLWRRKYNLFLYKNPPDASKILTNEPVLSESGGYFQQFAYINEPWLSWDFSLLTEQNQLIGSVNRNFAGFGREIFTDTGVYALRMDAASVAAEPQHLISRTASGRPYRSDRTEISKDNEMELGVVATGRGMTLDERAVMLAAAVSVDFDFFSRHSGHGGGVFPFGIFGGEHNSGGGITESIATGTTVGAVGDTLGETTHYPPTEKGQLRQPPPLDGQGVQVGEGQSEHYPWDGHGRLWGQKGQSSQGDQETGGGEDWWPFE